MPTSRLHDLRAQAQAVNAQGRGFVVSRWRDREGGDGHTASDHGFAGGVRRDGEELAGESHVFRSWEVGFCAVRADIVFLCPLVSSALVSY